MWYRNTFAVVNELTREDQEHKLRQAQSLGQVIDMAWVTNSKAEVRGVRMQPRHASRGAGRDGKVGCRRRSRSAAGALFNMPPAPPHVSTLPESDSCMWR